MKIEEISSEANPKFKTWMSLLKSQGLKKSKLCLLSGEKIAHELLKTSQLKVCAELITSGLEPLTSDPKFIFKLSKDLFKALDMIGTHFNLFVVAPPPIGVFQEDQPIQGLEMIAPLGDPNNLGALLRSCLAFGVHQVILTRESAHPFHPKTIKSSAGSVFKLKLVKGPFLKELKPNHWILDQRGKPYHQIEWSPNTRLLVGEEGPGSHQLRSLGRVSIPMKEGLESLNATVAASILLHTLSTSRLR